MIRMVNDSEQKLRQYPFCGGNARLIWLGHENETAFDNWGAECVKCGAMPWVFQIYQFADRKQIIDAVARKWNRRVVREQKLGRWIQKEQYIEFGEEIIDYVSSCCGNRISVEQHTVPPKYCANCGAEMEA